MRASSASRSAPLARPLIDPVAQRLVQMRLALVGGLLVAVDQHHLEAGGALTCAMPAPMKPAPMTPIFLSFVGGTSAAGARPC